MSGKKKSNLTSPSGSSDGHITVGSPPSRTTYFTDHNDVPLARPILRRERLARIASSLTWSNDASSEGPTSGNSVVDIHFQRGILEGLNRRTVERSSFLLKDRVKGTMSSKSSGFRLPRSVEDVRRRQEHVERRLVQMPVLLSDDIRTSSTLRFVSIVRNATLSELRDLYRIVSSLDARKFDIRAADVKAMFEWFATFENFVRLYLTISEKELYDTTDIDEWASLQGNISKTKRKAEKKRIIALCDKVEEMKRKMIAEHKSCLRHLQELHKRVDQFTMRLVRFLNEEVEQVPAHLERKFSPIVIENLFISMTREIRNAENGKDMVVLMARGTGANSLTMTSWVRAMCGSVNKMTAAIWIRKFIDRHVNYAVLFENAEQEYREMYNVLSDQVDDEIAGIRKNFERRLRISSDASADRK